VNTAFINLRKEFDRKKKELKKDEFKRAIEDSYRKFFQIIIFKKECFIVRIIFSVNFWVELN